MPAALWKLFVPLGNLSEKLAFFSDHTRTTVLLR
jgi:hypothetical protein